jgi:hypothetical protein
MTVKHVSQSETSHIRMSSIRDVVTLLEKVSIGASGAATYTSGDSDHPDFSCTKNGTGTYDLTYPSGKRAWIDVDLYSPSKTVVGSVITAKSASAGTATIKTLAGTNAAADTEPASGDKLYLRITVER